MRSLPEFLRTFLTAVTFFTRLPDPFRTPFSQERLGRCSVYLPVIGWIVGGISALVLIGGNPGAPGPIAGFHFPTLFPKSVAAAVSMAAGVIATGALHEDGLADFCDGFGGGWTKERILEIMKDSRVGVYGILGLGFSLFLKWLCLMETPVHRGALALLAGHSASRFFAAACMRFQAYAGDPASKAAALCKPPSHAGLAFAAVTGVLPLLLLRDARAFLGLVPMALVAWGLSALWKKKLGGYTGDCLGAAQQWTELAFYLFFVSPWTSI